MKIIVDSKTLKKISTLSQLAGIEDYIINNGRGKGIRVLQFRTGSGLNFQVIVDRGFDIYNAEFCGISIEWKSSNELISPYFFEPEELGFLRTFAGGLLTTCGLTQVGTPCFDENEKLGLHGRINHIIAEDVIIEKRIKNKKYFLSAKAKVKETSLFGYNLMLEREITTIAGEPRIYIKDKIKNIGYKKSPLMILYHINIGYPLLDEGAELILHEKKIIPRDKVAERGINNAKNFSLPQKNFKEQVFFYELLPNKRGEVIIKVINSKFKKEGILGLYIKYNKEELPFFTEWKMMGYGEYVVGLEPGNCLPIGRKKMKETGRLEYLNPDQKKEISLEIGIIQ